MVRERTAAIEPEHPQLTIEEQCELLGMSRSSYYYEPHRKAEEKEIEVLQAIVGVLREKPFYGYRKVWREVRWLGVTEKQVRRIMHRAGLRAIYPRRRLSVASKEHRKYPYLLKDKEIWLPNQVWATDITYVRLSGGYVYLVVILDLYSRKVLSWRVSNTMEAQFCVSALEEAIQRWGVPAIFNTDQGSQFTSEVFLQVLEGYGIQISMDGRDRVLDNIRVERFWRSLKYEDIYLKDYQSMGELKEGLSRYFQFYNSQRYHQALEYCTPDEVYASPFADRGLLEGAA